MKIEIIIEREKELIKPGKSLLVCDCKIICCWLFILGFLFGGPPLSISLEIGVDNDDDDDDDDDDEDVAINLWLLLFIILKIKK